MMTPKERIERIRAWLNGERGLGDDLLMDEISWLCTYAEKLESIVDDVNAFSNNVQIDIERMRYAMGTNK